MIKNRKLIRVHTFVWALLLALLFSSMIGIAAGKKPNKPGPPGEQPPPETFMFEIWIEGPDVVLDYPDCLTAEAYVDGCGWYPPKKGTRSGGWSADLNNFVRPEDECGMYTANLPAPVGSLEIDATSFYISRYWNLHARGMDNEWMHMDFWEFGISWDWYGEGDLDYYVLRVWTDWNAEQEGTYDPDNDMWIVDFIDASFEFGLVEGGYIENPLHGTLSFTVTIDKIT